MNVMSEGGMLSSHKSKMQSRPSWLGCTHSVAEQDRQRILQLRTRNMSRVQSLPPAEGPARKKKFEH